MTVGEIQEWLTNKTEEKELEIFNIAGKPRPSTEAAFINGYHSALLDLYKFIESGK